MAKSFIKCGKCKKPIEPGHFIAIIGKTPRAGFQMPVGRADIIVKKIGNPYCDKCFKEIGEDISGELSG